MTIIGFVLAGVAALMHVYIFYLESIVWTGLKARRIFGTTLDEALATRELAFNQGFYNLFLALAVIVGIGCAAAGANVVGVTLVLVGAGSMVAASLVLWFSSPSKRSAALKQGVIPAVGVLALALGLAL